MCYTPSVSLERVCVCYTPSVSLERVCYTPCENGACVCVCVSVCVRVCACVCVCVICGCSRTRAALSRRVHGPVQLASELQPVVHVDVVEHVLMQHICLRREADVMKSSSRLYPGANTQHG